MKYQDLFYTCLLCNSSNRKWKNCRATCADCLNTTYFVRSDKSCEYYFQEFFINFKSFNIFYSTICNRLTAGTWNGLQHTDLLEINNFTMEDFIDIFIHKNDDNSYKKQIDKLILLA